DPPTGLEPEGIRWLRDFLRRYAAAGRTVLVSSHLLAEVAQTVDEVVVLAGGGLRPPPPPPAAGGRRAGGATPVAFGPRWLRPSCCSPTAPRAKPLVVQSPIPDSSPTRSPKTTPTWRRP